MADLFSSCVFCRIIAGTEEASIVYQDDRVVAFLDVLPINPGHTLIVPRRHGAYLKDMDPADGGALFTAGMKIGAAIRASGVKCQAVNFLMNDGEEAGQRVFHSHLHVIPRVVGDSMSRKFDDVPMRSVLDEVAAKIRAVLG